MSDYIHYGFLAVLVAAALAFAWVGKIDVAVAFGIVGSVTGIAIPTATRPAADGPAVVAVAPEAPAGPEHVAVVAPPTPPPSALA